jgi:hypothetical protein
VASWKNRIAKYFKKLSIFAPPTHDKILSDLQFWEINAEKKCADFDLVNKGTERGKANQPTASSSGFDETEQKIISFIDAEKKNSYERYLDNIHTYNNRESSLSIDGLYAQVLLISETAKGRFHTTTNYGKDFINSEKRKIIELNEELQKFKLANAIDRTPQFPESSIFSISIVILLLLIETFFNGVVFFSKGHELGYLGGVIEALLISGINVGVSFLFGWKVLPYINHKKRPRKYAALIFFLIYLFLIFSFNLLVSHYRIAFMENSVSATTSAFESFLAAPFRISDFQSLLLIGLGMLFFIFAAIDGYKFDDPYPNYGNLYRKKQRSEEDYVAQKRYLYAELDSIKDSSLRQMDDYMLSINQRKSELTSIIANKEKLHNKFKEHINYLESICNSMLKTYRNHNISARTSPYPARFDSDWTFQDFSIPELIKNVSKLEVNEWLQKLDKERGKITKLHKNAIDEFKQIEDLEVIA